jgi:hypothetical protein
MPQWSKFQALGYNLTERDMERLIPQIMSQYDEARKIINRRLRDMYAKHLSAKTPAEYYNTMLQYNRLEKLLTQVTRDYAVYSSPAGKLVGQSGELALSNNYYRMQYATNWLSPSVVFGPLPNELLQISVYGSQDAYRKYTKSIMEKIYGSGGLYMPQSGTLTSLLTTNRTKEVEAITRAITNGLLQGNSYNKVSKEISQIIGEYVRDKAGNINATGAKANAIRIARTEGTRIMGDAALMNTEYARSEGLEVRRVWNATLDMRTRQVHATLDNKEEDNDGGWDTSAGRTTGPGRFGSVGQNVNCRCTTFESINGSRPDLRRGRNPVTGKNEVFDYKSFDEWAEENNVKRKKNGQLYVPNSA